MDIGIMIEGQNGLNWTLWQKMATAVEDLGFAGLFRSDHFTNAAPPDLDSLELWTSLTWLASHTRRIEFGPLVSPISFRNPVFTARMAAAVDELSGGRLILGLGAGWQEREHSIFGFDLLPKKQRFERFEEGLEVISQLLRSNKPVVFSGDYYHLDNAQMLPFPKQPGRPPILIGGNGEGRTIPLVAKYADEWNAVYLPAAEFQRLNAILDGLLARTGRHARTVRRSMMTGLRFGRNRRDLDKNLAARNQTASELRKRGLVVGVGVEIKEQLSELVQAGVERVMLQWLDLDDLAGLGELARFIL